MVKTFQPSKIKTSLLNSTQHTSNLVNILNGMIGCACRVKKKKKKEAILSFPGNFEMKVKGVGKIIGSFFPEYRKTCLRFSLPTYVRNGSFIVYTKICLHKEFLLRSLTNPVISHSDYCPQSFLMNLLNRLAKFEPH